MPPQVQGGGSVVRQTLPEEQKEDVSKVKTQGTSSTSAPEKPKEVRKEPDDPKAAAKEKQASKQNATEKMSQQNVSAQLAQKKLQKQIPANGTVWDSVKGAGQAAMNAFNTGARALEKSTTDAAVMVKANEANEANAHLKEGVNKAKEITNAANAASLKAEASDAAFGRPNPEYKKHEWSERMVGSKALAELGVYSRLKPKFDDAEKVIQKMDTYNREGSLSIEYTVSPKSMEGLLGRYGYYTTVVGSPEVQNQITTAALYNWRNTPPEARQALHAGDRNSPALRNGDYSKKWINPPQTSPSEEQRIHDNQVVLDPPLPGAYNTPYVGPRKERPDPEKVWGQAKQNFNQAGFDVINSTGGGLAAPGKPGVAESSGRSGIVEGHRAAPPTRNIAQEKPGGPGPELMAKSKTGETASKADKPRNESSGVKDSHLQENNRAESTGPGPAQQPPAQPGAKPTTPIQKTPVQELVELEKKGKITGDAAGLEGRLRSTNRREREKAEQELQGIQKQIENGKRPHIGNRGPSKGASGAGKEKISDSFDKAKIFDSDWFKRRVDPENRQSFRDWLKEGHNHLPNHEHLKPETREALEQLQEWSKTTGVPLRDPKAPRNPVDQTPTPEGQD